MPPFEEFWAALEKKRKAENAEHTEEASVDLNDNQEGGHTDVEILRQKRITKIIEELEDLPSLLPPMEEFMDALNRRKVKVEGEK